MSGAFEISDISKSEFYSFLVADIRWSRYLSFVSAYFLPHIRANYPMWVLIRCCQPVCSVEQLIYILHALRQYIMFRNESSVGSSVSSTETDIDTRLTKAWTAIDRILVIWKSDLTDKMKRSFFKAAIVSILLYGCAYMDAK